MKIHPGVKPAVWGAVAGAVVLTVVGFSSLGWRRVLKIIWRMQPSRVGPSLGGDGGAAIATEKKPLLIGHCTPGAILGNVVL